MRGLRAYCFRSVAIYLFLFSSIVILSGSVAASSWEQFQHFGNNTGYTDDFGIPNEIDVDLDESLGDFDSAYASVVVGDEAAYVGSGFGSFSSIWRNNASTRWTTEDDVGGEIQSAAALSEDKVFVAIKDSDQDLGVFSASKEDGIRLDEIDRTELGGEVIAPLSYDGDNIFVPLSSSDNDLVALDTSLNVEWRYDASDSIEAGVAYTDDYVFVYDQGSNLAAVNKTNGNEVWSENLPDNSERRGNAPTVVNDTVFVVSSDGNVYAREKDTGDEVWGSTSLDGNVVGSPAFMNDSLYIVDFQPSINIIDAETGTIEDSRVFEEKFFRTSPSIAGDTVYLGGEDDSGFGTSGIFKALNATDLSTKWVYDDELGAEVMYQNPAIADNQIFFTSNDDNLHILEGPSPDTEPPVIEDKNLVDRPEFTGAVKDGDTVSVYAKVTDERSDIDFVEADLSEFGAGSSVTMTPENKSGEEFDWNGDGQLSGDVYGTNATVDADSSTDGKGKQTTITAQDDSPQENSITTDPFGDLVLDTVPPEFENITPSGFISDAEPVIEANFTEETSGLSEKSQAEIEDDSGIVAEGEIGDIEGATIQGKDKIIFDFEQITDRLSEGNVSIEMIAEDEAGNTGEPVTANFTVDSIPPEDLTIDKPETQRFLQPHETLTIEYSYIEDNPFFTEISFLAQGDEMDATQNITEESEDPERSINIELDHEDDNFSAGTTYDITLFAQDEAGNTNTTIEEELLTVDDTPPVLNESEKTGETTFDFHVSDDEALNVSSIEASDFEIVTSGVPDGSFTVDVCESRSEQCTVSVELDERSDTDEITVGLTSGGEVEDAAGNVQEDDDVTVEGMDEVPPNITDPNLEDYTGDNGIVRPGHEILVHANVTDGEEVEEVEANLTEFGLGDVALESEASAGTDFYGDGEENEHVYGAIAEVQEDAEEGEGREAWVTATDDSDNSNTTEAFGDLEVDKTPPEIDIDEPLNASPAFIQPDESLEINYTYTEKNPEFLNITIGPDSFFFQDLESGENVEDSREFTDTELPGEGVYDLELWMNDSVSYEDTDLEEGSIFIDGTPPETVENLEHNDEQANEGFSVTEDVNFTWDEASDDISGVDFYNVFVSTDGGSNFQHGESTEDLEYVVDAEEEDEVQLKVQAVDRAGNEGDNETSDVITVDTTPPEVDIYTPISGDNIVNQSEASDLKINGTVENDDTGEVTVNVSGAGENVSNTTEFSDGTFEAFIDITDIPDGGITVEALATDEAGNTGDIESESATKDTTPPSIDEGFKVNDTAFNVTFSDDVTGLDPDTFEASDFDTDPGVINGINKDHMEEGSNEDNITVLIDPVDAFTVNFSITGEVRDVAGNRLTEGWVEIDDMDSIPPEIKDVNLTDYESDTGVVTEGDEILVHANVTDGHEVDTVEANLTEFGLSDSVSLQTEASAGTDFNGDGNQNDDIYGAIEEVDESAEDGEGKQAWITAEDVSGNSNTTDAFGDLEVDTTPPEIDIDDPLEASPVFLQPDEDLVIDFTYTEDNPEFVNASLQNESITQSVLFEGFESGEEESESVTYSSEDFPQDGIYDLNLTMNDSAGLQGSDEEAEAVYIDGQPPSKVDNLTHNDEEANEGFSVTEDVNFTWDEASDDISGVDFYNVYASTDSGTTFAQVDQGDIFEEIVDAEDGDEVQLKVEAVDRAGNTGENATSDVITVDTTPPQTVIDEPLAGNDIINSAEDDSFEVTGIVEEDDSGQITVNVTDGTETVEEEFEFSDGDFIQEFDVSSFEDGEITVEAQATDEAGNTGDGDERQIEKDTEPPSMDEAFKIDKQSFNVSFSDDESGLNPGSFGASDFDTDPGEIEELDTDTISEGDQEGNITVEIGAVDSDTVNFSIVGEVQDVAGNNLTEGWVEVEDMDSVPPSVEDKVLTDYESEKGIVTEGDEILVHANVTDGDEVDEVTADLTEFGLSDDVELQSEASAGTDFNGDGEENGDIYGVIESVTGDAEEGEGRQTSIEAIDASGNVNETEDFGDLEVDLSEPIVTVDEDLEENPVYIQPDESLEVNYTYSEQNPEFLNISIGPEERLLDGFDGGESVSKSETFDSDELPDEGVYDLELWMNDSVGLEGDDMEEESIFIDGTPPENVENLEHKEGDAEEGFSNNRDVEFEWDKASDDISGVDFYNVYISNDGGDDFYTSDSTDDTEFTYEAEDGDEVQIKVQAVDRAGNRGDNETSDVIVVDTEPPQIEIDTPVEEDDFIGIDEEESVSITGTIDQDTEGEIELNVTDNTDIVEQTFSFEGTSFDTTVDVSTLEDGGLEIEVSATDEAGNTGDKDNHTVVKDTVPPTLEEAFKIDRESFNVSFSDDGSGLDTETLQASEFDTDPGDIQSISTGSIQDGDEEGNITVEIDAVDSDTVNFSISGAVDDMAGNSLTDGWVEVEDMDSVPPAVQNKVLTDYESDTGFVTDGDEILVHANVTDGDEVDTVTADLSEFGLGEEVTLQSEASAGLDFNGDGNQNDDIYGVIETVTDSANEGEDRQTSIEAVDASGNVKETDEFGDLNVDLTAPIVTVDEDLEENPVFLQPEDSIQINYTYSEENPEFLNISIGPEPYLFDGFDGGESVSLSETFDSDQLPSEGIHDLELRMNDSAEQEGDALEEDSIFIDGTPPENVENLEHLEGDANEGYSNTLDVEFEWDEASDDISGVDFYNVYISGDGGENFHTSGTTSDTEFVVDGNESDEVQIKVQAVDRAGNKGDNETSETIIVDTVPPEIEIDTPVEEDDFIGLEESSSVSITGTVDRDSEGEIELNLSDGEDIEEQTFSFEDNTFDTTIDVSTLEDGELEIEASATDEAGNTGEKDNHTVVKDTVPPSLDEAFKIDLESFDAEFSDDESGLDPDTISASEFSLDAVEGEVQSGALLGIDTTGIDSGDAEGNATVIIERVDAEEINFSVSGSFADQAGNEQDSGYVTLDAMDGVEPEASDKNLLDPVEEDGVVSPGDTVQVYANVTDGTGIEEVTANLTEFGLGDVEMSSGKEAEADWNNDGEQNNDVYGTNATVDSSAEAGTASATITAIDNSSNSNELITEEFGELEIVKEASDINITDPTTADPVHVTPSDDVEVFFEYTEDDPEELNISIGDENQIFTDLDQGEDVETSRTYSSDNLPEEGTYDLSINLSNSGGLQGNDTQSSAVVIDETPPAGLSIDAPNVKQYEQSSDSFTVEYSYEEDNPHYTEIRLVNESGDLGLLENISETETEIEGEAEFTDLGELDEAVNYTVEVEAFDRAGQSSFVDEENILVVDDTPPVIENARKIDEGLYEFDVLDNAGLYEPSISDDNFRIKEDVEAFFEAPECTSGDLNCTVEVELLEETSEDTLTAEIDGSILDKAFNSRTEDNVTLEDTNTVQPGIEDIGLNVSTPVNDSYAPGTINLSIDFNESMNMDENPSVDINNLETSYTVTGDFDNSTRWTGLFDIQNDDEESIAFVNVSGAEDTAGNLLSEDADSSTFEVDTDEPEVIVSEDFEDMNLSGSVDISSEFSAIGGLIDSFEFDDGTGMQFLDSPTSWDSTVAEDGEVDFRVNASDDTGNTDSLTVTSTVDNEPPVIEKASIRITDAEEDFLREGDSFEIEVNASDEVTSVEAVNVNVSEVTGLEGWRGLEESASGNYTGEFTVNESVQIDEYRPSIFVNDSAGNEAEGETDNSVEVDSVPLEVTPDAVYTFLEEDEFDNGIATPGDVINVTWNSSEDGIDDIQEVEIDFGEFGGEVEASQNGDLYSATTKIEEGTTVGFRYSGFVDVVTDSEDDNATDEDFVEINNRIPGTPQNMEAEAVEDGEIDLSWDGVDESDLEEYIVFRNGDEEFRIDVTDVPDFPPETGQEYEYSVAAVDNASNVGPASISDSAIADDTPPEVLNATTFNETTINITVEDDYHKVVADEVDVEGGEAIGFDENAERLSGIFIMDEAFDRGDEPEISPSLKDTVGNERDPDFTVTAENGIRPVAESMTMEDVNLDGNSTLQIIYSHSMNTSESPDVEFSEGLKVQDSEENWVGDEVFEAVYEFDIEEGLSFTADVTADNATDDSGNVQIEDNSTEFDVNTVRPDPVIHDIEEDEIIRNEVLLNGSTDASDIQNVEWSYEDGSENQSIASLGEMVNETVWDTPEEELETVLWLEVENDVGNTGFDNVSLEVDNIPPTITGDFPDYITGVFDLEAEISVDEEASVTFEYNETDTWQEITQPEAWDTDEAVEGPVTVRVNATDEAGNFNSTEFSTVIDNTPPADFNVNPSEEQFIQPEEGIEIDYNYTEANPDFTEIIVSFSNGTEAFTRTVDEDGSDPEEEISLDTSGLESGEYTVSVKAEDKVGLEGSAEGPDLVVDSENPRFVNGTYFNDTRMAFQIEDDFSGLDNSTIDNSSFEVLTDSVNASDFHVIDCETGNELCDINVTLDDPSGIVEIGVADGEEVTDLTGNPVENTVDIVDPEVVAPRADFELNVSDPYNLNDAGKDVGLSINFSEEMNNSQASLEFVAEEDYNLQSGFINSTVWNASFELPDNGQEENVTIELTDIKDMQGNPLLNPEIGEFRVDFDPPTASLEEVPENVSGEIDLLQKLENGSSGFDEFNFSYISEEINDIEDPKAWNTSEIEDGELELRVNVSDVAGNNASDQKQLTVDNTLPEINSSNIQAVDTEPLEMGDEFNVTVNATDNVSGIQTVETNVSNLTGGNSTSQLTLSEGLYQETFQVSEEIEVDAFRPPVVVHDHAGNTQTSSTSGNVSVNAEEQDDDDDDDEGDNGDDGDDSDSGSGGSGGGGGGLPGGGDDDEDDTDEGDDEEGTGDEDEGDSGTLDPGEEDPEIDILPSEAFLEMYEGDTDFYRPEISVSEELDVQVEVEGLQPLAGYSEILNVEESRQIDIEVDAVETGTFNGQIIASAEDVAATADIVVEVIGETDIEADTEVDNGEILFNTSIDDIEDHESRELSVESTVYNETGHQVFHTEKVAVTDGSQLEETFPVEDLDPGLYTLETVITDDEDIYTATDTFRIEETTSMMPMVLIIAGLLFSALFIAARRGRTPQNKIEDTEAFQNQINKVELTSGSSEPSQRPQNMRRPQQQTAAETQIDQEQEDDIETSFEELDEKFRDDDIVKKLREASEQVESGRLGKGEKTLSDVKNSDFFSTGPGLEDIKEKVKDVHKRFEDSI